MAELIDVANAMFRFRDKWSKITIEEKEKFFFIFNRYFSKKYTTNAYLLNMKNIDKSTSMDLWYHYMSDKGYPSWFWSKSPKISNEGFDDKDYKLLLEKLSLNKNEDLDYLIINYPDLIKEELKFYKNKK
jgi:hypothetical protein